MAHDSDFGMDYSLHNRLDAEYESYWLIDVAAYAVQYVAIRVAFLFLILLAAK